MKHLLYFLLSTGCACAQIFTGSIVGSINDPSGLPVASASLTLLQTTTGRERKTQTDANGEFTFSGLDASTYNLTSSAAGFKSAQRLDVELLTGQRLSLGTITLELGQVTETVSVTAQAAAVETRSAERAAVITNRQVDNLLVRGRNVTDLVQLLPGVVVGNQQEDLNSNTNFYVQGNRQAANNISIDGVPATDMGNGFQLKLTVSQDAVAEVKILISNYQAEYGRMAGSNLQVVTKSGTREFHGLASYFKRHEQFNANNFFNNRDGVPVPRYRFNTWTYNFGGPVYIPGKFNRSREKLFFFWGQEFWPTSAARTGRVTVPAALERDGNFSQSLDLNNRLVVVRDPSSNAPFPGNVIPGSRIDASGQALLKVFAAPNFFDRGISRGQYNYVFTAPTDLPKNTSTLKLDYNVNSNHSIVVSFNGFTEKHTGSVGIPSSGGLNWPEMVKTWSTRPKSLTARYTRVFSPSVLNEFSFGWLTQPADDTYTEDELRKVKADTAGYRAGQLSPKANPLGVIPNATFGGVPSPANLTIEGRFPLFNRYNLFNWADNLTVNRGAHNLKAGVYIERFYRNQKKAVPFNGQIDLGRNVNNPLDTNYAYSNAALGVFNSYTEITDAAWMNVRTYGIEWFVQDNWKATKRLTLDVGMRFYLIPPLVERDNLIAGFVPGRFDPSKRTQLIQPGRDASGARVGVHPVTGQVYPAALIGAIAPGVGDPTNGMVVAAETKDYPRGLQDNRGIQWGPRVGFAYDLTGDSKTAVRGGFGIFYNRYFTETFFGSLVGQPPILLSPVITFGTLANLRSSSGLLFPGNVFAADKNGMVPQVMNFSFSIQRDLGWGTVLDAGYAGSLGRHLFWRRDINPVPLGANFNPANFDATTPGRALPAPFLRPVVGYNNVTVMEGAGSSNYHSMQTQVKRRFHQGLEFGLAWTWSKTLDFNDSDTSSVSPLVPLRVWNYGLASFDRTHVVNISYIWDVPGGRWNNAVARTALSGWQVSGITSFVSGEPLGIGLSTVTPVDITGTPSQEARVIVTGNPVLPKGERTFSRNFRADVFRLPPQGSLGNAAKTSIRGPGINNWDIALFKNFRIHEQARLQFRWELYNTFNHTQFSGLDTTARFDVVTGEQVNRRFGEFTAARNPRQMQFALRLYF